MNKIDKLPPFKRFCVTIGNLPSSYVDSMSYYECLMWLCKYLKDTVIPAVNENAEAVNELINWFNNLDVQDEIDNKLDEMAASGELEEIIASYLNTNAILGFNTLADLKGATNIINGSYAKTLGKTTINDGLGSTYKIRTVTSGDTVDEDNIVSLNISETLIAEKIIEVYEDDITIVLGDSFSLESGNSWFLTYASINNLTLNKNIFNFSRGGAGFTIENNNYLYNLQQNQSVIKNKKLVKKIIVTGGWNDRANATSIPTAIESFMNYIHANYPNAKVYVGMLANYGDINDQAGSLHWRNVLTSSILQRYKEVIKYGGYYLNGVEEVLHDYSLISNDYIHPNENGAKMLGYAISQSLNTGNYHTNDNIVFYTSLNSDTLTLNNTDVLNTTNLAMNQKIINGKIHTFSYGSINVNNKSSLYTVLTITVGAFTNSSFNHFRSVNNYSGLTGLCKIKNTSNQYTIAPFKMVFNSSGNVVITVTLDSDVTNINEFVPITFDVVDIINN